MAEDVYVSYTDFTVKLTVSQPALNIDESHIFTPTETMIISFGRWIKGEKGDKGDDGITPHIDSTTGNWFIGDVDTGVKAQGEYGQDGVTPHIDQVSGNWFIGNVDTGVHAQGEKGDKGDKGDDGVGIPQELSISGNNLSISDGNTVELPIPTVNNATLTIQKNSTTIDTFTANASVDKTINITVPTTAADVNALPSSTKYGASLLLSINSKTYVVTAQLKDQDGNNLGTAQTIDLPLESVVVSGSYDSTNKKIVLTLQNGSTIEFSVADLISGLQSEITAQNPLSADLVTDGNTNKVYTATEKTKLAGVQAGAEVNVQSDWNQLNIANDDYIKNKPIFIVNFTYTNGNYVADISAKEFIDNIKANCFPVLYVAGTYVFYTTEYLFDSYSDGGEYLAEFGIVNMNVQAYVTFMLEVIYHSDYDINTISFVRDASGTFSNVAISGSYNDLTDKPTIPAAQVNSDWDASSGVAKILNKPTLGTAAALDVAASGNANSTQVVKGDDTRLTDSRPASDVSAWAKEATKPTYTASEVGAIPTTQKGANGGVAELDSNGKVPSSQLPSYVDDVLEYASQSAFPATGESGKIYIALDTNKTYRWGGSAYTEISESLALGETSSTAYAGNKGKANADAIAAIKDGTSIDSFGDVETALADKINKSSTAGLVKNDGTIDTNTYLTQHQDISGKADKVSGATNGNLASLDANGNPTDSGSKASDFLTQHQDISGKANKSEMSVVDGTGSDADKTTITLKTGTSATVLKSHQNISGKQNVINSSNKLSADYIVDGTTNKVINVKPDWNAAAGNAAEILNKPTIPDAVSGTNDGTNWTSITIGSTTKAIPQGGSSLPSQTGNSGKFLTTDGTDASWANLPSDVVYCTWNGSTCSMTVKEIYDAYSADKIVICKNTAVWDYNGSNILMELKRVVYYDESNPGDGDESGYVQFLGIYTKNFTDYESEIVYNLVAAKEPTAASWVWSGGDYINLENLQDAISLRHSHSNKTYLDKIPSSVGSNGQVLTSNGTSWSWQTPSGGGLTNYDFTHTANQSVSGSVTVTYAANTRGSRMVSASADLSVTFAVNNSSDNYLWIKNTGSSDIDILISSVTYNNSSVSNVYMPADGITILAGKVCEIGIVCNADGAFITSRSDLSL